MNEDREGQGGENKEEGEAEKRGRKKRRRRTASAHPPSFLTQSVSLTTLPSLSPPPARVAPTSKYPIFSTP